MPPPGLRALLQLHVPCSRTDMSVLDAGLLLIPQGVGSLAARFWIGAVLIPPLSLAYLVACARAGLGARAAGGPWSR